MEHPDARPCVQDAGVTTDALLLSMCNIRFPLTWTRGQLVGGVICFVMIKKYPKVQTNQVDCKDV